MMDKKYKRLADLCRQLDHSLEDLDNIDGDAVSDHLSGIVGELVFDERCLRCLMDKEIDSAG